MKTLKDRKGQHRYGNPANAQWGTKEERKEHRVKAKAIRHKQMMHIPLSLEEEAFKTI